MLPAEVTDFGCSWISPPRKWKFLISSAQIIIAFITGLKVYKTKRIMVQTSGQADLLNLS